MSQCERSIAAASNKKFSTMTSLDNIPLVQFGEGLKRRMCSRAAHLYESQGGSGSGWKVRVVKAVSKFSYYHTQIDLYDYDRWRRGEKLSKDTLIFKILRYYMCYRVLHIATMAFFQYLQDFQLFKLRRNKFIGPDTKPPEVAQMAAAVAPASHNSTNYNATMRDQMLSDFATYRGILENLGAHSRDFTFMYEVEAVMEVMLGWSIMIRPWLIHRYIKPLDCNTFKMLDDSKRERANYTETTLDVLNKMIASSRERAMNPILSTRKRTSARQKHREMIVRLRRLALEGHLEPPYRTAKFMQYINNFRFQVMAGHLFPGILAMSYVTMIMPQQDFWRSFGTIYMSGMDLFVYVQVWYSGNYCFVTMTMHISRVVSLMLDRICLLKSLNEQAARCIKAGTVLLKDSAPTKSEREKFQDELTLLVANQKIGIAHTHPGRWPLTIFCLQMTEMSLGPPASALLHAPLFDSGVARVMMGLYIGMFIMADLAMLPICNQDALVCKLYMASHKLAALLTKLETELGEEYAYDSHLAWLLRAKLSDPDLYRSKLSLTLFGSIFDYTRFMRIQFWGAMILCLATVIATRQRTDRLLENSDSLIANFFSVL